MNGITSSLFGSDFQIKPGYSYTTKIIEIDSQGDCRLKIALDSSSAMPVNTYLRYLDGDGNINESHTGNSEQTIISSQMPITYTISSNSKVVIIFEYRTGGTNINLLFDITKENLSNKLLTDFFMFETRTGVPYVDHQIGTYSEYEFNEKIGLSSKSKYTDKTRASRILIGHKHENDRGTLRRICVLPKVGKSHKSKVMASDTEEWIYLDPLEYYQTPMSNSNRVIRGILLKTTD